MFKQVKQNVQYIKAASIALFCLLGLLCGSVAHAFHLFSSRPSPSDNIWETMQPYFKLLPENFPIVLQDQLRQLAHNQYYIDELVENASPYIYYVFRQTQLRHMPAEIALLPMIESDYNPFAYSKAGATGLWQMMPGTASGFGLSINWWYDGRRDIVASTKAALDYLSYLHSFFHNNWLLAIAAYDSGEGTVRAAIRHNKRLHKPIDFWSLPLPKETQHYIPKLLALSAIFAKDNHYGVHIASIPNQPYFSTIAMDSQINLSQAAKLSGVDKQLLRQLNPGFRRWATSPDEPYTFVLPTTKKSAFLHALHSIPKLDRVNWQHHKVVSGDTLSEIAADAHTTTSVLKKVNNLKDSHIRIGQNLLIPMTINGKLDHLDMDLQHGTIAEEDLPGPRRISYTVKANDSLWTIAARYGVTIRELTFWNKLNSHSKLESGDQLTIWQPKKAKPLRFSHYTVKAGDSLSQIAAHYHVSRQVIQKANGLKSSRIRVKQHLTIPLSTAKKPAKKRKPTNSHTVIVKAGDTLSGIAHQHHLTLKQLNKLNPKLAQHQLLKPGQSIKVKN